VFVRRVRRNRQFLPAWLRKALDVMGCGFGADVRRNREADRHGAPTPTNTNSAGSPMLSVAGRWTAWS